MQCDGCFVWDLLQGLRKKAKEEDGMVDTSNRWDAEVNSNSRSVNICPHKMEVKRIPSIFASTMHARLTHYDNPTTIFI